MTGRTGKSREATPEVNPEDERLSSEWWAPYVNKDMQFNMHFSGKLVLLAHILKMSESIGDKV